MVWYWCMTSSQSIQCALASAFASGRASETLSSPFLSKGGARIHNWWKLKTSWLANGRGKKKQVFPIGLSVYVILLIYASLWYSKNMNHITFSSFIFWKFHAYDLLLCALSDCTCCRECIQNNSYPTFSCEYCIKAHRTDKGTCIYYIYLDNLWVL